MSYKNKKEKGVYYTIKNPFKYDIFNKWCDKIHNFKSKNILEPFAGEHHIIKNLNEVDILNDFVCYDIQGGDNNIKQDTIRNFPVGFDVCITNPPYLAKNLATKYGYTYDFNEYDNLYKTCIDLILKNCKYVAVIIPENFIQQELKEMKERLYAVVSINENIFEDTDCPVCLALFLKDKQEKTYYYNGNDFLGCNLKDYDYEMKYNMKYHDTSGQIGIVSIDNTRERSIKFVSPEEIDKEKVKKTGKMFTIVNIENLDVEPKALIEECNKILFEYRFKTKDIFLSPYRGLIKKEKCYRRRLDFKKSKKIICNAIDNLKK